MAKVLEFQLQHQSFNEYSGLISFRMDWLDLLAVQGTLKTLLQHHSSKASILQHSACFMVQLSHPYMTTGKTIARWTFVSNVISLLNMLSSPVLVPGKSHGWRSLVGCSPWGCEESDMTERLHFHSLEKEMATHSSVLAWRIPGMGEPGRLPSMGLHRVGHD